MSMEGYLRENDPKRAETMADFSNSQHTEAAEMRAEGHEGEASRLEREAYKAEMQAGALHDAEQEAQGLSLEEMRQKYEEASAAENDYAKSNLDAGNREYTNDVTYIQLAQRRAVLEKTLHTMEKAA